MFIDEETKGDYVKLKGFRHQEKEGTTLYWLTKQTEVLYPEV